MSFVLVERIDEALAAGLSEKVKRDRPRPSLPEVLQKAHVGVRRRTPLERWHG